MIKKLCFAFDKGLSLHPNIDDSMALHTVGPLLVDFFLIDTQNRQGLAALNEALH